jgi:hypothetical protein
MAIIILPASTSHIANLPSTLAYAVYLCIISFNKDYPEYYYTAKGQNAQDKIFYGIKAAKKSTH